MLDQYPKKSYCLIRIIMVQIERYSDSIMWNILQPEYNSHRKTPLKGVCVQTYTRTAPPPLTG